MKYCSRCGGTLTQRIPPGDDRQRFVCDRCRTVHYENPRLVVGCIPEWEGRILLCRRAIEPRRGKWTLPAGYLENGETVADGARRETYEEACTELEDLVPYALFNLTFIRQVYLMFRAQMRSGEFGVGSESLAVRLFDPEDLPWDELAFPVILETLRLFCADNITKVFPFHTGDITLAMRNGFF